MILFKIMQINTLNVITYTASDMTNPRAIFLPLLTKKSTAAAANITIFGAATPREVLAYQAQPALIVRSGKVIEQ